MSGLSKLFVIGCLTGLLSSNSLARSAKTAKQRDPGVACSPGYRFVSVKFFKVSGAKGDHEHSLITCKKTKRAKRLGRRGMMASLAFVSKISPPPSPKSNESLLCSSKYEFVSIQSVPAPGKESRYEQYFVACRKKNAKLNLNVAEQMSQSEKNWKCEVNCQCLLRGKAGRYRKGFFKSTEFLCQKQMSELFLSLNNDVCSQKCEALYQNRVISASLANDDPALVLNHCKAVKKTDTCE